MYDVLPKVVVDANIFIKIFAPEPDSQTAREFLSFCNQNDIAFIAPTLFEYEVIGVCVQKGVDLDKLLSSLNVYYKASLSLYKQRLMTDNWRPKSAKTTMPKVAIRPCMTAFIRQWQSIATSRLSVPTLAISPKPKSMAMSVCWQIGVVFLKIFNHF